MSWNYTLTVSLLIVAGIVVALLVARKLLFGFLRRLAGKTETGMDDILLAAVEGPSTLLIIAFAIYIGIRITDLPVSYAGYAAKGMLLSLILTITMGFSNISGKLLAYFLRKADLPISVTGLLQAVTKAIIYIIGFLIILNYLGISITPIITALGVGGLAMALALQDTLSNLFAGIHILAEHTIRVGDYIRLENGQEGFVEDISWRTTRIRLVPNNMVIVPNSKLAQSIITNYHLPEKRMIIQMTVGVSYDADPDEVERILVEETKKAVSEGLPGLLADPAPFARLAPGFGESSLDFTLFFPIGEVNDQNLIQHELRKRILKRFRQEAIAIPFPTRIIYVKEPASEKEQ
jgi:small-conductance mechanosensitive channel